ncbi:hypothetical protein F5Y16DRAFT_422340 [Xylariaceae sp. FL0255]|nr:hypothetical protein F5Y16DRAFT_422340 [Xylariaceae sp. FL0255]
MLPFQQFVQRTAQQVWEELVAKWNADDWVFVIPVAPWYELDDAGREYVRQQASALRGVNLQHYWEPELGGRILVSPRDYNQWGATRTQPNNNTIANPNPQVTFQSYPRPMNIAPWQQGQSVNSSLYQGHQVTHRLQTPGSQLPSNQQHGVELQSPTQRHTTSNLDVTGSTEPMLSGHQRTSEKNNQRKKDKKEKGTNAFLLFRTAYLAQARKKFPELSNGQISQRISKYWWSLTDAQCRPWFVKAAQLNGGPVGKRGDPNKAERRRIAAKAKAAAKAKTSMSAERDLPAQGVPPPRPLLPTQSGSLQSQPSLQSSLQEIAPIPTFFYDNPRANTTQQPAEQILTQHPALPTTHDRLGLQPLSINTVQSQHDPEQALRAPDGNHLLSTNSNCLSDNAGTLAGEDQILKKAVDAIFDMIDEEALQLDWNQDVGNTRENPNPVRPPLPGDDGCQGRSDEELKNPLGDLFGENPNHSTDSFSFDDYLKLPEDENGDVSIF